MVLMILCLFPLFLLQSLQAAPRKRAKTDDRVYLIHSDELRFDMYGPNPEAQIVKGHVQFRHQGAQLWCDSAYFFQETNSVKAFGHVRFRQGDTLSLNCDRAYYDGQGQLMQARRNVVLTHRRQVLYTDSLDFDRLYNNAYFFEGGRLVDGKDQLVADWGEYNTSTRQAVFYYDVKLRSPNRVVTTDTLYYDTRASRAHVVGPSTITSGSSVINTEDAYFNTQSDHAEMFGRSTIVDKQKAITGDSLFYNSKTGQGQGFGNVVYEDKENKNMLLCNILQYNEKTGAGVATQQALVKDYSQRDTLYLHADTLRIETFHIDTDSVYRKVHGYPHARAYRTDVQAVCDSLVFSSLDSCMTMYRDPIVWSDNRQLLGERIMVYMNDSTVRRAEVVGQALSVEKVDDESHYNQISSKRMDAYFEDGNLRRAVATGNVKSIYYPEEEKDSALTGLNYLETDTLRMFLSAERQLEKIWTSKFTATLYPMTQIPPSRYRLPEFAWFEELRPVGPDDVFVWRGKGEENKLRVVERHKAPLQVIGQSAERMGETAPAATTESLKTEEP